MQMKKTMNREIFKYIGHCVACCNKAFLMWLRVIIQETTDISTRNISKFLRVRDK